VHPILDQAVAVNARTVAIARRHLDRVVRRVGVGCERVWLEITRD
jgi:hypothetical protein